MDDISNRTLALMLISAIVVTLATTVWTLNSLGSGNFNTGKATTDLGTVNLSVENAMSIILLTDTLDFGIGQVNNSNPTCITQGHANLSVTNTGYQDENDCWGHSSGIAITTPATPFRVENDGNQNVTLSIRGPPPLSFFNNAALDPAHTNLTWKGYNQESSACGGTAANLNTAWTPFNGADQTVCASGRFGFVNASDELHVHVRVVVPQGLTTGVYQNTSILFTAS